MISTSQRPTEHDMIKRYNAIHATIDAMGKALLELMRHPDATNDQIDEARLKYFMSYTRWIAARIELRKRYPGRTAMQMEFPWNKNEQ